MKEYLNNFEVQFRGCDAFHDMIKGANDVGTMRQRLGRDGAVSAVVDALEKHHGNKDVHGSAIRALEALAPDEQNASQMASERALDLVLNLLVENRRTLVPSLEACCRLLDILCTEHSHRAAIAKVGGIATVIKCMQENERDRILSEEFCRLLGSLSADEQFAVKIGEEGGIHAIIQVMRKHRTVLKVQRAGCMTLCKLATVSENSAQICTLGGVEMVVAGMNEFRSGAIWQTSFACLLFAAIVFEVDQGGIL